VGGSASLTLVMTACSDAVGQSACDAFVNGLDAKNAGMAKAQEAMKKLWPGPPEFCGQARKLAGLSATLAKQIEDGKASCRTVSPEAFVHLKLRHLVAVSEFNAALIGAEVDRLCR
jgi:hypothetical protein